MKFLFSYIVISLIVFGVGRGIRTKYNVSFFSYLFLCQAIVTIVAAFFPLIGIPFEDPKRGGLLVSDEVVVPFVFLGVFFFLVGLFFLKRK